MTTRDATSAPNVAARHNPVLLSEVLQALELQDGETYIDCTFGAGGYTRGMLEAANTHVVAFDRDPMAVRDGQQLVAEFAPRLTLVHAPFGDLADVLAEQGITAVDGVVMDIGVSSMQLDEAERGFSFQTDGPLDMRMSQQGLSAADVVNSYEEEGLANVIYELGDERKSRAIARAIVKQRATQKFTRTSELARLVEGVLRGNREPGRHPATRTFQALRMHVNDELGELTRGLLAAEAILKPGGRLLVVTFHSLEDRIVKRFLAARSGREANVSRYLPEQSKAATEPSFRIVNLRGSTPSEAELEVNPRSRSARLRVGLRTDAPAWPSDA